MTTVPTHLIGREVNHFGFSVANLEETAAGLASALGVGPFFKVDDVQFDRCEHDGKPCVFRHSAAFAAFGQTFIEIQEIADASPSIVADGLKLNPGTAALSHVAFVSSEPELEVGRLESMGCTKFLELQAGPVENSLLRAPFLGCSIEIIKATDALDGLWSMIRDAARGWDGTEALREIALPD